MNLYRVAKKEWGQSICKWVVSESIEEVIKKYSSADSIELIGVVEFQNQLEEMSVVWCGRDSKVVIGVELTVGAKQLAEYIKKCI